MNPCNPRPRSLLCSSSTDLRLHAGNALPGLEMRTRPQLMLSASYAARWQYGQDSRCMTKRPTLS